MESENYKSLRRREVLDGVKSWSNSETGGDHDRFYVEYVLPLRRLRGAGLFESSEELTAGINGEVVIFAVEITGAVNYEA